MLLARKKEKSYDNYSMDNEKLIEYFKEGLIPNEEESLEDFQKRALFCLGIKTRLRETMREEIPPFKDEITFFDKTNALFGIKPLWVPVISSNHKLMPWQGASAWIFQLGDNDPLSALIQLRSSSFSFLGTEEERVTHEMVHIARMAYEEPRFEEILAYSASPSWLRRYLGPIFRSNKESLIFTAMMILVIVLDLTLILSSSWNEYDKFMGLKLLPFAYLFYLFIRLVKDQRIFDKVKNKVGLSLSLVLLDREFDRFAHLTKEEIMRYLEEGRKGSLRRRLMALIGVEDGR